MGSEIAYKIGTNIDPQAYAQYGHQGTTGNTTNRFGSFAPERSHSDAKWYVDGCSYMYAVSRALESARESIWIMDCEFPTTIVGLSSLHSDNSFH
jgi:phospholipase D1/2